MRHQKKAKEAQAFPNLVRIGWGADTESGKKTFRSNWKVELLTPLFPTPGAFDIFHSRPNCPQGKEFRKKFRHSSVQDRIFTETSASPRSGSVSERWTVAHLSFQSTQPHAPECSHKGKSKEPKFEEGCESHIPSPTFMWMEGDISVPFCALPGLEARITAGCSRKT